MKQFLGQSGSFCIDAFNATAVTGASLSAAHWCSLSHSLGNCRQSQWTVPLAIASMGYFQLMTVWRPQQILLSAQHTSGRRSRISYTGHIPLVKSREKLHSGFPTNLHMLNSEPVYQETHVPHEEKNAKCVKNIPDML